MSFSADLENQSIAKGYLVKVSPRVQVTGWTLHSGTVYKKVFTLGPISRVWIQDSTVYLTLLEGSKASSIGNVGVDGDFYYDDATSTVYVKWTLSGSPDSPPSPYTLGGIACAFDIFFGSSFQVGNCDPIDSSTPLVEWRGALQDVPFPSQGSSDQVFGYLPRFTGAIRLINTGDFSQYFGYYDEGNFNHFVWNNAHVVAYLFNGDNLERAISTNSVSEIFVGFVTGISEQRGVLSLECSDYLSLLDKTIQTTRAFYRTAVYPFLENQDATAQWAQRRFFGMMNSVRPINLHVSTSPTQTNNRQWGVMYTDARIRQNFQQYTVDHTKSNTSTETYTTTTPKVLTGDAIAFPDNSAYAYVTSVDYTNKKITHTSISRTVSPGDRLRRYIIGNVVIVAREGVVHPLFPERHYDVTEFSDGVLGFQLRDNMEVLANPASGSGIPHEFDPDQDQIICRAYGDIVKSEYEDSTEVLDYPNVGGVDSRAASIAYRFLREAGIPASIIDKTSWESAGADSLSVGFSIPRSYTETTETRSYIELFREILAQSFLRIGQTIVNNRAKLVLIKASAITDPTDFTVNQSEYSEFSFSDDFTDIYSTTKITALVPDFQTEGRTDFPGVSGSNYFLPINAVYSETAANPRARFTHFVEKNLEKTTLHFDLDEASEFAIKFSELISDRRRLFKITLPQKYLGEQLLGKTFTVQRDVVPGSFYSETGEAEIKGVVIQVDPGTDRVRITLDDISGIQDHLGDW